MKNKNLNKEKIMDNNSIPMNIERFKLAYDVYWEMVKNSVDEDGWAYNNELPFMVDGYFEFNTGKSIEYQKYYEGEWRGCRWRPKELS